MNKASFTVLVYPTARTFSKNSCIAEIIPIICSGFPFWYAVPFGFVPKYLIDGLLHENAVHGVEEGSVRPS